MTTRTGISIPMGHPVGDIAPIRAIRDGRMARVGRPAMITCRRGDGRHSSMHPRPPKILYLTLLLGLLASQVGAVASRLPRSGPTPEALAFPEGYVPAADLLSALSSSWVWDPVRGRLEVVLQTEERLVLLVDSGLVALGDRLFRLEDPIRLIGNRLMVPESLITDVLEPVLGHPIQLPTLTPEPGVLQPGLSPTPAIESSPMPWLEAFRGIDESRPAEISEEPKQPAGRSSVVVLDPGHGGEDQGSVGLGSTTEAGLVLRIAQLCEESLEAAFDVDVRLTRREDRNLPTVERIAFANAQRAQAFISLHAGGLFDPTRSIPSVLFLSGPTDVGPSGGDASTVRWWDQRSPQLPFVLWQLGSAAWSKQSRGLADELHDALVASYRDIQGTDLEDGSRPARLAILRGLLMPGALLELGSLSNLESEQILHREGFQRGMAESLARAIGNWVYGEQGRSRRDTQVP